MTKPLSSTTQNPNREGIGSASDLFRVDRDQVLTEIQTLLQSLKDQRTENKVSPASVRSFYQTLHTLKAMLGTEVYWAEALNQVSQVEGLLACTPLIESSRQLDRWLPQAEQAIQLVTKKVQEKNKIRSLHAVPSYDFAKEWGMLIGVETRSGIRQRAWVSLKDLHRVLSPEEFAGRQVVSLDGKWVPVLGVSQKDCFGFYARDTRSKGFFVISVSRVFKVCQRVEAMQQRALLGTEALLKLSAEETKSEVA